MSKGSFFPEYNPIANCPDSKYLGLTLEGDKNKTYQTTTLINYGFLKFFIALTCINIGESFLSHVEILEN